MLGHGATFIWNGNVVGKLTSIGGISLTSDKIDNTTHESTIKEYLQGIPDGGDVSLEGYFNPSDTNGQIAMLTDMKAQTERECVITLPKSVATLTFNGFLISYNFGPVTSENIPFSATVAVNSDPVLGIAASAGLTSFAISNDANITPTPSGSVYDYVANVLTGVSSVTVTPTASAGTIKVNGNVVTSGQASSAIPLGAAGSVTLVTITVTETNKAPKTYTVRVVRA